MSVTGPFDLLLYDGVCGLCNRAVQFVLPRDKSDRFRFAPLQSDLGAAALAKHGVIAADLNTVYVLTDYGTDAEALKSKSDAVLAVLPWLGAFWRTLRVFKILPRVFRDRLYDWVAKRRYRFFGKYETCPLPSAETRAKFLAM